MEVKIKKLHPDAVIPVYKKDGDAGMDLTATTLEIDINGNFCYGVGLGFEIPKGFFMDIRPRSSNTSKDLVMLNSPATIDSGYRGEVTIKYRPLHTTPGFLAEVYDIGDRIAQAIILPFPDIQFIETDTLSITDRGIGSYGSTGK